MLALDKFPEAEAQLVEAQRMLGPTEAFHVGALALAALYTTWDQAEPGKGYDAKAQQWLRNLIGTFVQPKPPPDDNPKGKLMSRSRRQQGRDSRRNLPLNRWRSRDTRACRLWFEVLEDRRLLAVGDLDPTFGGDGFANVPGYMSHDMALQPDGKGHRRGHDLW